MNKKNILSLSILFILAAIIIFLIINKKEKPFYLENNYYGTNSMTEIKTEKLNKLIEKRESFAVFVYQPMCVTSSDFENILNDFLKEKKVGIYKIAFSHIKDTEIGKSIKYYPSFIIFNKGKMIDFLEANKDEDVNYYTSKKEFESWFRKYIKIKNNSYNNNKLSENISNSEENKSLPDVNLENIVKEDKKVNIYFFWGDGCPHCEQETEFFESFKKKYGNKFNLYKYEVWYNKENSRIMEVFANAMEDKVSGVPYTIIGEESFSGFSNSSSEKFIEAINKQSKNDFDVYFDKIKK